MEPDDETDEVRAARRAREERGAARTDALRSTAQVIAATQAAQLVLVADLLSDCEREVPAFLAAGRRGPGDPTDEELVDSIARHEVMLALGISRGRAEHLVQLAGRLTRVLPDTLTALREGRLDLPRAQVLAESTAVLSPVDARTVEARLLAGAGDAPWEGPSPRAWRARAERAVTQVDADAARRRHLAAVEGRSVRTWPNADGTATLRLEAAQQDITMADQVITQLALAWPQNGPDGTRLTMDQRRCDAVLDVFRRIRDGRPSAGDGAATAPGRAEPEVGIVLHADTLFGDTLFGDGVAADAPGLRYGLGTPTAVDAVTAVAEAGAGLARGAGTRVLLVDDTGALQRVVRLGAAPGHRWSRELLTAAVRAALPAPGALGTDGYAPTRAIADHVRAATPTCSGYDCPRPARRCDLDHDQSWPRGPTHVTNLDPKCRREHVHKTLGLVRTRLHPDRSVTWVSFTGTVVTTRPEPLPGYGPGERAVATAPVRL